MSNPYRNLPDFAFWSRSVSWAAPGQLDPVTSSVQIKVGEPVATMGSCFAQHISRHLSKVGLDYMVTESAPENCDASLAREQNYGVFTARFGNVYTVRQAVQLFDRAFGAFSPVEDVWSASSATAGGFVDAFRPQIQPAPWSSVEEVRAKAHEHFTYVREMFMNARWLVFTLGLTEAWQSRRDGAVYPVAPGVAGGAFDQSLHQFVNFSASDVRADLIAFIERVRTVNKECGIILTVSPVPLIATYEPRHVLVSTCFSKSVLRVVADEAERMFSHVTYFPSYEIITSASHEGRYWEDDLRQVTDVGVAHVMRVFSRHFIQVPEKSVARSTEESNSDAEEYALNNAPNVVCDEELIEKSLRLGGFPKS